MNTNKNAKRILVYGDSFTFGKIPGGARFDSETRFTGVLQKTHGENFEIMASSPLGRVRILLKRRHINKAWLHFV